MEANSSLITREEWSFIMQYEQIMTTTPADVWPRFLGPLESFLEFASAQDKSDTKWSVINTYLGNIAIPEVEEDDESTE